MSVEHGDLSEYGVPLEAMPGSSDTQCLRGIGYMALDPITPGLGPSDLVEFERRDRPNGLEKWSHTCSKKTETQ